MAKKEKSPKDASAKAAKKPKTKATTDRELSDADLEAAAGGMVGKVDQNRAQKESVRKAQAALE